MAHILENACSTFDRQVYLNAAGRGALGTSTVSTSVSFPYRLTTISGICDVDCAVKIVLPCNIKKETSISVKGVNLPKMRNLEPSPRELQSHKGYRSHLSVVLSAL